MCMHGCMKADNDEEFALGYLAATILKESGNSLILYLKYIPYSYDILYENRIHQCIVWSLY